jgi:hypothetical protein
MTTEDKLDKIFTEYYPGFLTYKERINDPVARYDDKGVLPVNFMTALKRAYNMAIDDAYKSVKLGTTSRFQTGAGYSKYNTKPSIDKKSILKLKIKMT